MGSPEERRTALRSLAERASACVRCPQLAGGRRAVVFGAGDPDADLMFVGEAPGGSEERLGAPLAGRAGDLLDELLAGIGRRREDVFVTNALMCRPPGNRDALPQELASCRTHLDEQVRLVAPAVLCPLGHFATRLLRGEPTGVTQLHGRVEEREVGGRTVRLYPLFHPAAALYTPAAVEALRADFARIPELLALGAPEQAQEPPAAVDPAAAPVQLGLF
jgi:DNA polymerase